MNEKVNPYNDELDLSEECLRKKHINWNEEGEPYFPIEESQPPHY